jgi:hypothetical protein
MISKKIKYHLKNIMSTGLPLWNNKEKFTSTTPAGTGSPATGDPFAEARSSLSTNDASLQSAKGLVNSIDGSLNQLKEALGGMNLENLLNGLGGIQNGVGDLRTLIIALRTELRQCCGRIDSLVSGQNKLITKTTGIEISAGSSNTAWMTKLSFGLSIASLFMLVVILFMMSRNCRR